MKILSIASLFSAFLVTSAAADIVYVIERNISVPIGTSTLIKAQENNNTIGCIAYTQDKPQAHIYNFYVDSKYRKNSVGTQLLKTALYDIAAQKKDTPYGPKYTGIELDAEPTEDSPFNLEQLIKYYNKFGFQVTANYGHRAHMVAQVPLYIPPVQSQGVLLATILGYFKP